MARSKVCRWRTERKAHFVLACDILKAVDGTDHFPVGIAQRRDIDAGHPDAFHPGSGRPPRRPRSSYREHGLSHGGLLWRDEVTFQALNAKAGAEPLHRIRQPRARPQSSIAR